MQDRSISSVLAMEILQSCIKPSSHKELDKSLQNALEVCLCCSLTILFIIGRVGGVWVSLVTAVIAVWGNAT